MSAKIKKVIREALPAGSLVALKRLHAAVALRGARRAFYQAPPTSIEPLPFGELDRLQAQYSFPPDYGYDPVTMRLRGEKRAAQLLKLTGKQNRGFLEAGCADGMTCAALADRGKMATGIDLVRKTTSVAQSSGAGFCVADAMKLPFGDSSFDVYYSYNAYEHIPDPGLAFEEALRVTKAGGYIYLNFGPLYMAPLGSHAYRHITVPYCQFLFSYETMQEFADARHLGKIPFESVNGWSLEQFRHVWQAHASDVETLIYREIPHVYGKELIPKYPDHFRSKTAEFDNLVISLIEVLCRKR